MGIRLSENELTELLNNSDMNDKVKKQLEKVSKTTTEETCIISQEKRYIFIIENYSPTLLIKVLLISLIILILLVL